MTDEPIDPELDRLFDLLAEEEREKSDPAEHPGAATLSSYYARTLPDDQVPRVQEHLIACRRCRDQLLEYAQFMGSSPKGPADSVPSFKMAAQWRRLKARMADQGELRLSLHATRAAAAVLGALAIGLALYAGHLRGRLMMVRGMPETTLDLSVTRGGAENQQTIRLPQALKFFVVSDHLSYRIEIVGEDGRPRVSQVIGRSELMNTFPLAEDSLAPGKYLVRLYGLRPGKPEEAVGRPLRLLVLP